MKPSDWSILMYRYLVEDPLHLTVEEEEDDIQV